MRHHRNADRLQNALKHWRPDLIGTLVFVQRAGHVLLIDKKTGHGAGRINGPGGKVEAGESASACASRELWEELRIEPGPLTHRATIRFVELRGTQWLGYVFVAHDFAGVPTETREARPRWHSTAKLPLAHMWPDDGIWLPRILAGEKLAVDCLFDDGNLISWQLSTRTAMDPPAGTRLS